MTDQKPTVLRARCGHCGRPAGRVIEAAGKLQWHNRVRENRAVLSDRMGWNLERAEHDYWLNYEATVHDLPKPDAADPSAVFATCERGHPLVADLALIASAVRARVLSVTLPCISSVGSPCPLCVGNRAPRC